MTTRRFLFDYIVKWGTPWHGKMIGATIHLPNATTMSAPGDSQYADGGDFFKVQVPDHPAAVTTEAETEEGKEWLNYGIISAANHLFYGKLLGERSWLYVAPDKSIWLVDVYFPGATAEISFKRFGLLGQSPASVAQTIYFTPSWTTIESIDIIQDITPKGEKVMWSHRDATRPGSGRASRRCETMVEGITLLTIGGTPPEATALWVIDKTKTECAGTLTNTRLVTATSRYRYGELFEDYENIVIVSTIVSDTVTWDYPTDGPPEPAPEPEIPDGYAFASEQSAGDGLVWSEPWPLHHVQISSIFSGEKNISGAISGCRFKSDLGIDYVTVNCSMIDVGEYSDGEFIDVDRSGSIDIKVGSAVLISTEVSASYYWDSDAGECTALYYKMGDFFEDNNAAHYTHYFGGGILSGLPDIKNSDVHIAVYSKEEYGSSYYGARLLPVRYANHCYGQIYVEGPSTWSVSPTWSESSGSVAENHQAFSANGASSVTASWSGTTTGTEATQHALASSNPVNNDVAISTSDNVCYV